MADAGVRQRMRLGRVLVGFDHQPPGILVLGERAKDGIEIDRAIPRHGEHVAQHRIEKAHVLLARGGELVLADVLAVT